MSHSRNYDLVMQGDPQTFSNCIYPIHVRPAVEDCRPVNTVVSCWQVKWTPNSYSAVHMGLDLHTDPDNLC